MAHRTSKIALVCAALALAGGGVLALANPALTSQFHNDPRATSLTYTSSVATKLTSIKSITIPVSNLDVAKAYYTAKLGFTVVSDTTVNGVRLIAVVPPNWHGGATLTLSATSGAAPGSARGVDWQIGPCAPAIAALKAKGALVGPCEDAPPGPLATITDVDGNELVASDCGAVEAGTIANLSVPVTNQTVSKDFYVNKLGFSVIKDRPNPPPYTGSYIELEPPGGGTRILLDTWNPTNRPGSLKGLQIGTADYATSIGTLKANGVPVTTPSNTQGIVTDPDGNTLSIS